MEPFEAIRQELDRQLAGRVPPRAYQAYLNAVFRYSGVPGLQLYLRRLSGGLKGGEKR